MIKINLLPGKAKKDSLKIDLYIFFIILILFLVCFGGIYYTNSKHISNYENKIADAEKLITSLQNIKKEYLAMEEKKREIQRRIKTIEDLREGRALSARILYDFTSLIKDNVWIKSLRKTGGKFELEGYSLENESISILMESMSNVKYIKNIELKNIVDEIQEGVTIKKFIISGDIAL